jgi:hypothetical protein
LHENAQKIRLAFQGLRALRAAVCMAQEMGARLGERQILFGTVPPCYRFGNCRVTTIDLSTVIMDAQRITVAPARPLD